MSFKLLLLVFLLSLLHCSLSIQQQPFASLNSYSKFFQVEQSIKNQFILSQNIIFNATRQKYYFIYFPLFETCLQKIGEDFQPILNSVTPSGIGAAGYGVLTGMNIALKVGLWKTGIFGLLKASTATLFSVSALPAAIGVGALAYMYNKYQQDEIKQKCSSLVHLFESIVNQQELNFLARIKATVYKDLVTLREQLNQVNQEQKTIKLVLKKYQQTLNYVKRKIQIQQRYFISLRQIINY